MKIRIFLDTKLIAFDFDGEKRPTIERRLHISQVIGKESEVGDV